jgi:Transposase
MRRGDTEERAERCVSGATSVEAEDELVEVGLEVFSTQAVIRDRRRAAALQMQLNKTDENDAEGLAQIMRTGWYRAVHVKSLDAHRARALLGTRAQLMGMTTRLSNMIRGVLKTFGSACCLAPVGGSDLTGRSPPYHG